MSKITGFQIRAERDLILRKIQNVRPDWLVLIMEMQCFPSNYLKVNILL